MVLIIYYIKNIFSYFLLFIYNRKRRRFDLFWIILFWIFLQIKNLIKLNKRKEHKVLYLINKNKNLNSTLLL